MILDIILIMIGCSLGLSLLFFLLLALHYRKPRERRSVIPITHIDVRV